MHIVTQFISQDNVKEIGSKHSTPHAMVVTVPYNTPLNDQSVLICFNRPPDCFVHCIMYLWNDLF